MTEQPEMLCMTTDGVMFMERLLKFVGLEYACEGDMHIVYVEYKKRRSKLPAFTPYEYFVGVQIFSPSKTVEPQRTLEYRRQPVRVAYTVLHRNRQGMATRHFLTYISSAVF